MGICAFASRTQLKEVTRRRNFSTARSFRAHRPQGLFRSGFNFLTVFSLVKRSEAEAKAFWVVCERLFVFFWRLVRKERNTRTKKEGKRESTLGVLLFTAHIARHAVSICGLIRSICRTFYLSRKKQKELRASIKTPLRLFPCVALKRVPARKRMVFAANSL